MKLKTRTESNLILLLAVITVLSITALPFLFAQINSQAVRVPTAKNGISDFSGVSVSSKKPIYLKGEWLEYQGQWIITDTLDKENLNSKVYSLPVNFFSSFEDIDSPLGDKSSYALTVKNLDMQNAVIYIPHFAGSYRIFINGYLVSQSGEYTASGTKADLSANTSVLSLESNHTYEIIIEVSCNYMPGLYMTPAIADSSYVSAHLSSARALRSMIFGAVAFCTALFIAYSVTKKKIFHSKWLPVLFVVIMLRLAILYLQVSTMNS